MLSWGLVTFRFTFAVSGASGPDNGSSKFPHSKNRSSGDSNDSVDADGKEAEVESTRTDNPNSGFWEQFLQEDPQPIPQTQPIDLERASQDQAADMCDPCVGDDNGGQAQNCTWNGRGSVEYLAHQMGQLAPG